MILIELGIIIGFFIGRMKWSKNLKFVNIVQFSDTKYGVRCGVLGLYVYRNFSNTDEFSWQCKFSNHFTSCCMVEKNICEKYMINGTEKVV